LAIAPPGIFLPVSKLSLTAIFTGKFSGSKSCYIQTVSAEIR